MNDTRETRRRRHPYDAAYKLLFGSPEMVASLLRDFVPESFVAELDFATLERCSGSYVTDDLRERHTDMLWRLRWKGDTWCYLYILLEFQSTVDAWMAVRVLGYTALLWQDLIRTGRIREGERLPPVFPLVLYNGGGRWTARQDVAELLPPLTGPLAQYQPRQRYFLLEESQVPEEALRAAGSLAGLLLRLERVRKPEELLPLIDHVIACLRGPQYRRLSRAFAVWIRRVVLERAGMTPPGMPVNDLLEVRAMLADRVAQWKDEYIRQGVLQGMTIGREEGMTIGREEGMSIGREEGMSIGREEGMLLMLRDLLESRLGALPKEVDAALRGLSDPEKLRGLMPAALHAVSYAEFLEALARR